MLQVKQSKHNDYTVIEFMNSNNLYHSIDYKKPSVVIYNSDHILLKVWHNNGLVHREKSFPSYIEYYPHSNKTKMKCYLVNNKFHRENGPAIEEFYENGIKEREIWFIDDKKHRENAPAVIEYFPNGKVKRLIYYKKGKVSRDIHKGPAIMVFDEHNQLLSEEYIFEGKFYKKIIHRPEGDFVVE